MKRRHIIALVILFVATSCKDKFNIDLKASDVSLLVVEGVLKTGSDVTTIKLTKSGRVDVPGKYLPVSHAQLTVESNAGTAMSLTENGNTGIYTATLGLDVTKEYRLRIKTQEGKEYLSDYIPVTKSPPIDALLWKYENNGVMIYANTHDATSNSRYYKWEFDETWEIISPFYSTVKLDHDTAVVARDMNTEDVSHCWKYGISNTIMIASSAQLTSDVINEAPLYFLPKNTEKIGVRYSTLVKQMVLTKDAYEYFSQMKQSTEQLGSIFDPLPSELRGNIHCLSDPKEPVIGYVAAGSQTEKRIFISHNQVPEWLFNYAGCETIYVKNQKDSIKKYFPHYWPYEEDRPVPIAPAVGFYAALPACSDCTLRGGTNIKPSYW